MARKRAKSMDQRLFWASGTAGAPEKTVSAAHGFTGIRQNAIVHTVPRVHPGNVGLNLATGREGGAGPKKIAVLGSALFFAVAPSSVAGLVPWWITHWEFRPPFFDLEATRAVGILLIVAGLPGLVDSFARFALQGLGTPAPIAPTQNLVVTGLYRHGGHPIYVALVAVILALQLPFCFEVRTPSDRLVSSAPE